MVESHEAGPVQQVLRGRRFGSTTFNSNDRGCNPLFVGGVLYGFSRSPSASNVGTHTLSVIYILSICSNSLCVYLQSWLVPATTDASYFVLWPQQSSEKSTGKEHFPPFPGGASSQTYKSWGSGSWRLETGHRCSHGWKGSHFVSSSVPYFTWVLELQVTLIWSHLSWTGGILEMFQQDVSSGFDVHDDMEWSLWTCKGGDVEKDFQLPSP